MRHGDTDCGTVLAGGCGWGPLQLSAADIEVRLQVLRLAEIGGRWFSA
jgi:hypothetical protein